MPDAAALWTYLGIFSALIAAGLGAPIPEEIPVVTAGALVGHASEDPESHLRWYIMLPICIAGVVISDVLLYSLGRWWGPSLLETRPMKKVIPPAKRHRIEDNFHQYGVYVLLFARFLPAIRSPIFITAGVMRLPLSRFVLADGLYAIPGVNLLFWLAFWFGDQFRDLVERAVDRVDRIRPLLILLVIAAAGGFLLYHFLRRPVSTGDPKELPVLGQQVAAKIEHQHESKIIKPEPTDPPQDPAI